MSFCPNCGKMTKKGFCDECMPTTELKIKNINVKVCVSCKKFFHKNKWNLSKDITESVIKVARDNIKEKVTQIRPVFPKFKMGPGIKLDFSMDIQRKDELFIVPGQINFTYCDACSKKQGQYFEGTLQLRKVNEEILDFVEAFVKNNNFFIADKREVENGYDLDISDQRKLQNLGQQLKKYYGGTLKVSIRQFTQNRLTSKQIYRVNVFYEGSHFKKNDVLRTDKGLFLITSVRKEISAVDLKTGKKATIDLKNKEYVLLTPNKTTVSKVYPHIEVFDPDTYQSVPIQNKKEVKMGEKVKIVNDNELFYIV